jgi:anti-sigma factor RsiW
MKPFESQTTSPNPLQETEFISCNSIAPLLMELFDGEADEITTKRARAHLLACEHCAQAWLEWNQTQSILRTNPVPAPPPTLLWRVLLAIRFANFKRQHRFAFFSKKNAPTLGALYSAFEPHEAPASMKAQILAATSRQSSVKAPAFQIKAPSAKKKLVWPAFPMLAAPALAALLFVVSRGSIEELPTTETVVQQQVVKPKIARDNVAPIIRESPKVRVNSTPKLVAKTVEPVVTAPIHKVSEEAEESATPVVTPVKRVAPMREPKSSLSEHVAIRPNSSGQPSTVKSVVPEKVRPILVSFPITSTIPKVRLVSMQGPARTEIRPLVAAPKAIKLVTAKPKLSNDVETPTPRVAELPLAGGRGTRLVMSRSAALPTRVTEPAASGPKVTLASYNDDSDEHLNELLTVVADFREVLASDDSDDPYGGDES